MNCFSTILSATLFYASLACQYDFNKEFEAVDTRKTSPAKKPLTFYILNRTEIQSVKPVSVIFNKLPNICHSSRFISHLIKQDCQLFGNFIKPMRVFVNFLFALRRWAWHKTGISERTVRGKQQLFHGNQLVKSSQIEVVSFDLYYYSCEISEYRQVENPSRSKQL